MAKKFGFFNSINGDRKYLASDISQAFDIGVTTGIKAEEDNLKVVAYEGMQVQIQPGSAMIFGYFYINDEPEIIYIDTADAELNRIDRIVLRYDVYTREVNTAVIKGSPALSPTPPAILRTNEQYDLVLADLYVPAAATEIGENNITDTRDDSDLCGYIGVKGAVSQLDFDAHLAESASKHIAESGSNDDGYYIRFDDGTQECWFLLEVPYATTTECLRTWTFPKTFMEGTEPNLQGTHRAESNITRNKITGIRLSPSTNNFHVSALVRALSFDGDFTSDSIVMVNCRAIGRWK